MKRLFSVIFVSLCESLFLFGTTAAHARDGYRGPPSDHFDGERFFQPGDPFDKSFSDLLRYWWERERGEWTRDPDAPTGPKPPERVGAGRLRVTYINHSTVLVQADGLNILTDPIYSERASPWSWAGPRRYRPPGIAFADLPNIDVVLVSHNHHDHFDPPTLVQLQRNFDPLFVVGLGDGELLREQGIERYVELDWWQSTALPSGCRLWSAPAKHWSGRALRNDRNKSLWQAFVIETAGGPVYFVGDSGYGSQFAQARERLGAMRLALLPIGAYLPRWLTQWQHMDPAEAVQAHADLAAAQSIGIHWGTFELSDDGQQQPPRDLAAAVAARALPPAVFPAAEFGAGYDVPAKADHPGCSK